VLILSTEANHHLYFINKMFEQFDIVGVVYERRRLAEDYPTGPFFVNEEACSEDKFFDVSIGGVSGELPESLMKRMIEVHSVNQPGMAAYIQALEPDVGITYGVGPVDPVIFSIPRWGTINVHLGISEEHRGLDSALWAVYCQQFDQIGVTIHHVDEGLNTGDILAQERVSIEPSDEIYQLRYKLAIVATRLMKSVLSEFAQAGGMVQGKPQKQRGSYYSAIPLDEKYQAFKNFHQYKEDLFYAES